MRLRAGNLTVLTRRVLIVDEQPLFRAGVQEALAGNQYLRVIGDVGNVHQALRAARHFHPHLAVISDTLPGISGLTLAETLAGHDRNCAVVLVVDQLTDESLRSARISGAAVVIQRSIPPGEIPVALSRAIPFQSGVARFDEDHSSARSLHAMKVAPAAGVTTPTMLSSREMEVLDCVAHGLSNKEIANELYVSEQTVKNHMTSVFRKMEVEDRVQALLFAVRHGWVTFAHPRSHTPERTSA
jgi:DNA-binding NarL/FixJ family response regulator